MKQKSKNFLFFIIAVVFAITSFSISCTGTNSDKQTNAHTAFAETKSNVKIPTDALSVVESLQTVFRSISKGVLPSVVELDVVEKKTVQSNPMQGFPFFFFNEDEKSQEREYTQQGLGSGVIVRRSGKTLYVLTNNHVVGSASEISVKLNDERTFTGKLVGKDERKDIALVSFESDDMNIPVAILGDSDKVERGDICFAMGTPLGYGSSVTQGIISATGRSGSGVNNISDFIQTDAAINQGNSGGPLINIYGEIIGINTWIASQSGGSQGLGFAIPINNVKKAIDDFITGGKVTYGWLGVSIGTIEEEYKKDMGLTGKDGGFAFQVFLGSPAAKGGIQPGDYITALNGKPAKDANQLTREIGDLSVGETATFTIIRAGKQMEIRIKIEERLDTTVADSSKLWPGFIASPLTESVRQQLKLDAKTEGILVANVEAKSPASVISLQPGDIITAVCDKEVKTIQDFYKALSSNQKEIWFDVIRSGHKISTMRYKM